MFTQVGVGGLIVGYAALGALAFPLVEEVYENPTIEKANKLRNDTAEALWGVTEQVNMLNTTAWIVEFNKTLFTFQLGFTDLVRQGYEIKTPKDIWGDYPTALMFCLSVFSMIGYGNIVPKTTYGKVMTMIYATFGIPLYILYFQNMGKALASTFRWLYTWFHDCSRDQDKDNLNGSEEGSTLQVTKSGAKRKVIVPSTACLWVMSFYLLGGTVMFATWEGWDYHDAIYFVVISLCKIGFGDLVPGGKSLGRTTDMDRQSKLIINFIYILFGMALVAMCYRLMREEVREKFREIKEDTKLCLEDISQKFAKCFGVANREDEFEEKFY